VKRKHVNKKVFKNVIFSGLHVNRHYIKEGFYKHDVTRMIRASNMKKVDRELVT
jgi:hypothetical protein